MAENSAADGRPRVLFLNRSYWPDSEATGQLLTQLCEDLSSDYEVHVLCGHPNVVEEGVNWNAVGRETHQGVEIHRVRHLHFGKGSFVGRVLNMCSFTISAFFWATFCRRPAVVVSETDPFLLPFIALWTKIRHRCKFVAYLQDIYPDIAVAVEKVREGLLTRFLRKSLWFTYRFADRIIVLSEDMKQRCIRNGARPEQIEIIRNWADTQSITPTEGECEFRVRNQLSEDFVVMYSGNHGLAHELMPIIDAAEELQSTDPDIQFAFVGGGVRRQELERAVIKHRLNNVRFFPYQPWKELSNSLGAGDVHILSVRASAYDCMSPSKLYGILAAGRPVVALIDPKSSHAGLIEDNHVGMVCDVTQRGQCGHKLAIILAALRRDTAGTAEMGKRARRLAVRRFSRDRQTRRFASLLQFIMSGKAPQRRPVSAATLPFDSEAQKETELDIPVVKFDELTNLNDSIHSDSSDVDDAYNPRRIDEESGINLEGSGINL